MNRDKFIKDINRKWLISYILGHMVLFAIFVAVVSPTFNDLNEFLEKLKSPSGFFPLLSFPLAIVFEGLIHSNYKAIMVFWRIKYPYPGCRAFSQIAHKDPRINLEKLMDLFPEGMPIEPADQNAKWYELYRVFGEAPIVYDAHRYFILTRDMAALTVIMIPFSTIAHLLWHSSMLLILTHVLVLIFMAIVICISSQNYGKRFVANVLVEAILNFKA